MFNGCLVLLNGCLVLLNGCLMDVWWMFGGRVTHGNPQRLGPSPWFIPSAVGAQAPISQPRGLSRSRSRCASRCSNDGSQAMSCWYYLALLGMSCPSHLVVLCCPWCIIDVSLMYPDVLGSVLSCHMMPKFACRQLATTRYHWYHEFTMIRKWFALKSHDISSISHALCRWQRSQMSAPHFRQNHLHKPQFTRLRAMSRQETSAEIGDIEWYR